MATLKKVLLGLVGACALLAVIGLFLPGSVTVSRSTTIARAPADVYAVIVDMRRFNDWSPWSGLDPQAKYTLSGPPTGPGAALSWAGNDAVGSGTVTIVAVEPDARVDCALEFTGFGASTSRWDFAPEAGGTRVTWSYSAELGHDPLMRWMGLMMDRWVGPDYAKGLANLKRLLEAPPAPAG